MIKLTVNPELNYANNRLTVVGAFEQDGRLYDIVVESEGDLLKQGGQMPDLAKRIQGAWQAAYGAVLAAPQQKKLAPENVAFAYRPDGKIARVTASGLGRFCGMKSKEISETMQNLYRDIGARVFEARLHEPSARAAAPSPGIRALQTQIAPLFDPHAKNSKHLFHGHLLEDVKTCPKAQKAIRQALTDKKGEHFEQIQAFIHELQQQLPSRPGIQEVQRQAFARRLFAELFLSEANRALLFAPLK